MGERSTIEWTDATWQPITGCTLVSEGCRNCYAARLAATRLKNHPSRKGLARLNGSGVAKFTGEVRLNEGWLDQPLRWRRPRRIFVCAHGDLFHESVPDAWIDQVFAVMAHAPQHRFQVLTKRPERARRYLSHSTTLGRIWACLANPHALYRLGNPDLSRWPLPNLWLGISVEDQDTADERVPQLLAAPAAIRFVSYEPALGPVDLWHPGIVEAAGPAADEAGLDWVIAGGESGPGARPAHPDWFRKVRDDCAAADVPFFMKQWGEWQAGSDFAGDAVAVLRDGRVLDPTPVVMEAANRVSPVPPQSPTMMRRVGKKRAGRLLDGQLHDGFPEVRP